MGRRFGSTQQGDDGWVRLAYMGLLRQVLGLDNSTTPVEGKDYWAKYDGTRKLSVVGESNYQEALMRVSGAPAKR